MTTASLSGPNRLHFSTNGDGHETKEKEDSKDTKAGRDGGGRFAKGNSGGPGNPHARRVAHFRKLVLQTVTDKDLEDIVVALILKSKEGDVAAARLLLAYTLGKPAETVDPDRLDIEEWRLTQEGSVRPAQMQELLATLPADKANELLDIVRPCVLEQQLIDPMLTGLAKLERRDAAREGRKAQKAERRQAEAGPAEDLPKRPVTDDKRAKRGDAAAIEASSGEANTDNKRAKRGDAADIEASSGGASTDSKPGKRGDAAGIEEPSGEPVTDSKRS